MTSSPTSLEELLADAELAALHHHLARVDQILTANLPREAIYTFAGELNLGSRWGAILYHTRALRAVIRQHIKEV